MLEKGMQKTWEVLQNGAKNGPKSRYFMLKSPKREPRMTQVCIENRFREQKWWKTGMPKTVPKFEAEKNEKNARIIRPLLCEGLIFGGAGGLGGG